MVDIRQSTQYASYLKGNGWIVERINDVNYFLKKLPIVGYVLKVQRPEKLDFKTIDKLYRKYRIFQIIVEPKDGKDIKLLASKGFKLAKSPFLPSKTLQIDLTKNEKTIFNHFKKDARYAIRKGSGQIVESYLTPSDIKKWQIAWKNSVNLSRYVPSLNQLLNLRKSFPNNNSIFLASHNISSRIIGGALFTKTSHGVAYYWHGFTNFEGRTSLSQYSLLYQGILWAKRNNCKVFDFEGIYDPRFPNKSWFGFTHFKKSFRGYEIEYPGCYTKTQLLRM